MQVPTVKRDFEAQYHYIQYPSQPVLNLENHNEETELGNERNQAETDLFALTSKLSCLGEKAQQLEQFFRIQSICPLGQDEPQQQQAKSSLNLVLSEVISTSVSILSQCQILNIQEIPQFFNNQEIPQIFNVQETEPKEEEEEKVEVIEMDEDDILAEHVHFCKICGKGFRRDGNVRIHMRSHGNQYKTQEALKSDRPKPTKSHFSCPIESCRRNRGHPNFKPLKSMVCLRNHYRRSHCAKMYTCNNCGKEFSFLTDLKTHGNKCGHSAYRCSCNTTFSTKDKLFRHVALFQEGHKPLLSSHTSPAVAAPLTEEKATSKGKSLDCFAQDADDLAPKGLSNLAEDSLGYGSDKDPLMFDGGSGGMQYMGQENEFDFLEEYREENELYGSLFWADADMQWP